MNRNNFIVLIVLMLWGVLSINAQNRMNVRLKNGTTTTFSITDVDYIYWNETEGDDKKPVFEDINIKGTIYRLGISGAIDLGLSVKWATSNVGASSPGEYGEYYAWGETESKWTYNWSTYLDSPNRDGMSFTKYNTRTQLAPEDDVAHVKWGSNWRMPTRDELNELVQKCCWIETQYAGHKGYAVIGPNGLAIFLPWAGYRIDTVLEKTERNGCYWTSTHDINNSYSSPYQVAFSLYSYYMDYSVGRDKRCHGLSVRPVCP